MGRRAKIFKLLAGENVDGDKMNFGVAVLAGLGGTHFHNLAGATFDDDEAVFAECRALLGVGGRGASIGALEGMLMLVGQDMLEEDSCFGEVGWLQ